MPSPPWRVVGVSVQGTSHREGGAPCQDAQTYRLLPTGPLVVAVADGAGTASRADVGARLAVERAAASLAADLQSRPRPPSSEAAWRLLMLGAFWDARAALDEAASAAGIAIKHVSTTLTCAVAADGWLAVGQIGDGAAVAAVAPPGERDGAPGALRTVLRPRRGEYANEVIFLTTGTPEEVLDEVDVRVCAGETTALAVTTDGLLRLALKLPGHEPHVPFFRPLLTFVEEIAADDRTAVEEELAAFLASARVNARTDDDKTLVLATRAAPARPAATAQVPDTATAMAE